MSIADILGSFKSFFSRDFWFGSFLPVALFSFLHYVIAAVQFPESVAAPADLENLGQGLIAVPLVVAALVVLAYVLTPFTPAIRGFLDGALMPGWLRKLVRRGRVSQWRAARIELDKARKEAASREAFRAAQIPSLQAARKRGVDADAITDATSIERAEAAANGLERDFQLGRLPSEEAMQTACDRLAEALAKNSSQLPQDHPDKQWSRRLDDLHGKVLDLLSDSAKEAEYYMDMLSTRHLRTTQSLREVPTTAVGEARRLTESYSRELYDVEFGYLWPRLQLALSGDSAFQTRLSDAHSRITFSVLSTLLSLTIPLFWLPALLWVADSPYLFLTLGIISPFVVYFCYMLVVESQLAFGEVAKAAIDRHRLEVLVLLNQPPPATLADERATWERLRLAEAHGGSVNLVYRHQKNAQ